MAWVTALTMALEIGAGWWFKPLALLADGWHMGTHAAAIGLTAVAYAATRRLQHDPRFAFGPWKVEVLAAFASAVAMLGVAVAMIAASLKLSLQDSALGWAQVRQTLAGWPEIVDSTVQLDRVPR